MSLFVEDLAIPERVRVSVIERLVPAISFGLAALSGIVGGAMTLNFFTLLRQAENAGMEAVVEGLTNINSAVVGLLSLSIVIGLAGVIICAVRMFSETQKSSPPGTLYLVAGIPNLISPLMIAYAWSMIIEVMTNRHTGNVVDVGARVAELSLAAMPVGIVTIVILPVFSFVPFSSRPGKKILPVVALTLMLIAIASIAYTFVGLADLLMSDPELQNDSIGTGSEPCKDSSKT